MKSLFVLFLFVYVFQSGFSQSPESVQADAIKKMSWWIGEWKGIATTSMGQGKVDTVSMHESIKSNLGGTILLIEGIGYRVTNNVVTDEIVHHAFGVLSYDDKARKYRWQAWRIPYGVYTEYAPEVAENEFKWGMDVPQGKMRYIGKLESNGEWHETGEFSRDEQSWFGVFEMKLTREK